MGDEAQPHRLRPWTKRCWALSAGFLLLSVSPLAVAFLGLALENQYLATYHWLLYFSIPLGLPIAVIGAIIAMVMTFRDKSKPRRGEKL